MTLTPLGSKVVLQPLEKEKVTQSGIVIPDTVDKNRSLQGTVIAVGPGALNDKGERVPVGVQVGDMVLYKKYGPDEFEIGGVTYVVADATDLLAVVTQ